MLGGDNPEIKIQCNGECGVYCLCCWAFDVKHSVVVTISRESWESEDRIFILFFYGEAKVEWEVVYIFYH